jgi:hypothetical protein
VNAAVKLGSYGLVLAAVVGGGAAVGDAVGPVDVGDDAGHEADAGHAGGEGTAALPAGGLLVSQDGYTLEVPDRTIGDDPFTFTIDGPDGRPVTRYEELHDRELHLILVSRDLDDYLHVHPERDATGTWSTDLPDLAPGSYRAFADVQPAGAEDMTLGIDVVVPGPADTPGAPPVAATDEVDGFEVRVDGALAGGEESELVVTVRRGGEVVTTEPYLGAAGHLVAVRDGDLAYLHVHPLDEEPSGPVRFAVEVPSDGTYALFFDFQVGGEVRSARFVLEAGDEH